MSFCHPGNNSLPLSTVDLLAQVTQFVLHQAAPKIDIIRQKRAFFADKGVRKLASPQMALLYQFLAVTVALSQEVVEVASGRVG